MKHLITGIAGFAGSHLADKLLDLGEQVYGLDLPNFQSRNIAHMANQLTVFPADLNDQQSVRDILKESNPDFIYHLAAISNVKKSFDSKVQTFQVNFFGAFNLLETLLELNMKPKILLVGSASQYGSMGENDSPLTENTPLKPMSPYGLSKTCQEYLGVQYYLTYGLPIVMVRCFNYTGTRQAPEFVCSDFAKQVAEIERGSQDPIIHVGNLDARRDFTDVADMMDAYVLALTKAIPGEIYNLCSGKTYAVKEILHILLSHSEHKIDIRSENRRFRPSDIMYLRGNYSKFAGLTGWEPRIPFSTTLFNILEYWRENI